MAPKINEIVLSETVFFVVEGQLYTKSNALHCSKFLACNWSSMQGDVCRPNQRNILRAPALFLKEHLVQ